MCQGSRTGDEYCFIDHFLATGCAAHPWQLRNTVVNTSQPTREAAHLEHPASLDVTTLSFIPANMNAPGIVGSDTELADGIAARLAEIRCRVAQAAQSVGRPAGDIQLVAVSKTHPAAAVMAALTAGQWVFGENRVQEAGEKFIAMRAIYPALRLHLIGGLQTNKARDAVRLADVIEVMDRPRLADAIADAAQKEGRQPDLLVQVNVGDEPQKGGVSRVDADSFIAACQARFGDRLTGLMCIPPAEGDPAPHFAWLAARAATHGLHVLSMGMSADFAIAIAHGATHVRVGSAIFGHRPAPTKP